MRPLGEPREHNPANPLGRVLRAELVKQTIEERFRASHHMIAKLFAMGADVAFVSRHTGMATRRLSILLRDVAFQELIVFYQPEAEQRTEKDLDLYRSMIASNALTAERQVQDQLEAADAEGAEPLPIKTLLAISRDAADRLGYGKKSTVAHESNFAEALNRAVQRSGKEEVLKALAAKQIEAVPADPAVSLHGSPPEGLGRTIPDTLPRPANFVRRF